MYITKILHIIMISSSLSLAQRYGEQIMVDHRHHHSPNDKSSLRHIAAKELSDRNITEFTPLIAKSCESDCYCNTVPNYPEAHAIYLLQKLVNVTKLGALTDLPLLVHKDPLLRTPDILPLCLTVPKNIIPQAVRNSHGHWVFVLNPTSKIIHSFKVLLCRNLNLTCDRNCQHHDPQYMAAKTNTSCNPSVVTFGGDYKGFCFQNYIYVLLYTIDRSSGDLRQDWHKLPSGCSCEAEYK